MKIPVAQHPRRIREQCRGDDGEPGPAPLIVDPLERLMLLVIGNGEDGGSGLFRQFGEHGRCRRDPIGHLQHRDFGIEARCGFHRVGHRDHADAFGAQPLERGLEGRWHALDHDHDRRRSDRRRTACLIFDKRAPGERRQRVKSALVVLILRSDQRAERHSHPFLMATSSCTLP